MTSASLTLQAVAVHAAALPSLSLRTLGLLALAALLTFAATWIVRRGALALGFLDRPNPIIPQHTRPIAYGGGLALSLGVVGTLALLALPLPLQMGLPGLLFLALGLYDDARRLSPAPKFLLQALVSAVAVGLGITAPWTGIVTLDLGLSGLLILTWVNACNFTDVCDGVLSGLGAIGLAGLAMLLPEAASLAWAAAGACLGFFFWNRPPATIFLGDAGSHLLGFLLAALSIELVAGSAQPLLAVTQAALVAAVPLFELAFLTIVRIVKHLPWWRGSPDHFSLRLQVAGCSRLATDFWAFGAALLGVLAALALPLLALRTQILTIALALVAGVAAGLWLKRHEVPPASPRRAP